MMAQTTQEIAEDVAARLGLGYVGVIEQLEREFPSQRGWEHARQQLAKYPRPKSPAGWLRAVLSNARDEYGEEPQAATGGLPAPLGHPDWLSYLKSTHQALERILGPD